MKHTSIRKPISVLLSLLLVLSVFGGMGTIAKAAEPHTHDEITFAPWESTDSLPADAGSYVLTDDVTVSATWAVPAGETNLCLDGHHIYSTFAGNAVNVADGAVLNMYDKADNFGTIGHASGVAGCGVNVAGGTFTMNGGTITGNTFNGNGAAVSATSGTFNLKGGVIEGNVANNGAVNVSSSGVVNMTGGTIQYNSGYGNTGGVLVLNNNFTMSGGVIQYNAGLNFGGIGIANAQPNISGTAVVKNNMIFSGMNANNTKITKTADGYALAEGGTPCDVKHATANGLKIKIVGALESGAQIGVFNNSQSAAFTSGFGANNPGADPSAYFFSNRSTDLMLLDGSQEVLMRSYFTIVWKNWDGTVLETDEDIEEGTTPTYDGEMPTRTAEDGIQFEFSGWTPGVSKVTGEATYTAFFNKIMPVSYREASWDSENHKVVYSDQVAENAVILNNMVTSWENGRTYAVTENTTINARVAISGDVKLILCDGATLTVSGITVKPTQSLTIYAQEAGTGTLVANGGIGGLSYNGNQIPDNNGGTISIHGGVVTATGWDYGGAIGAGVYGTAGTVNIYGGRITATGGSKGGAGIGGGVSSRDNLKQNSYVNIYGGYVKATGRGGGAGIGGGAKWTSTCTGADVKIYGGTVIASGQVGIGAGKNNSTHKTLELGDGMRVYNGNVTDYANTEPYATGATENVTDRYGTMKVVYLYSNAVASDIENGTVTAVPSSAGEGETVTLTNTPDEGCEFVRYIVKDADGNEVAVNNNTFTMPAGNVSISAEFKATVYSVNIEEGITHGTVTADPASATIGKQITITVQPDANCALKEIKAFKKGTESQSVALTALSGSTTGGEGYDKLVDGKTNTKWGSGTSGYVVVKASQPVFMAGYSLTTANDTRSYSGRNWKNWVIYGANFENDSEATSDSAAWKQVTSVTNDTKLQAANYTKYDYTVETASSAYQYYKIELLTNKAGSGMSQMSEFSMLGYTYGGDVALTQNSTDRTKYTFTMPGSSVSVNAVFLPLYTITWTNDDGTVIDTTEVFEGELPVHDNAAKTDDADYTYTFAGWSPAPAAATADTTYTATYTSNISSAAQAAANNVIGLIDDIGTVELTDACKEKIDAARAAYDALTDTQKSLVTNSETLTNAETDYAALQLAAAKADAKDALDAYRNPDDYRPDEQAALAEAIAAGKTAIDAAADTEAVATALANAKAAIDAIKTDAQLTAEEKAAADQVAADEVAALIDAIGEVEYTDESKAKIDAARAAYDELTDDQKALVENDDVLTAAEAKYAELKEAAETPDTPDEPETPDEPADGESDGEICGYCGKSHPKTFFGSLIRLIHALLYFFKTVYGLVK